MLYFLCKNNPLPSPEKGYPLFPSKPPLKIEILSTHPPFCFFGNFVGGPTPQQKGGLHTMGL